MASRRAQRQIEDRADTSNNQCRTSGQKHDGRTEIRDRGHFAFCQLTSPYSIEKPASTTDATGRQYNRAWHFSSDARPIETQYDTTITTLNTQIGDLDLDLRSAIPRYSPCSKELLVYNTISNKPQFNWTSATKS